MSLETFKTVDDMYLARGPDVNPKRLLFTGDVYEGVDIPTVQTGGLIVVIEHPCAIRGARSKLNDHVLVASVREHNPVGQNGWTNGYYDLSPLPELKGEQLYVADFRKIGRVSTEVLTSDTRVACSKEFGINLLQQRLVWNLTRCFVPTKSFSEAFAHTFEEASLAEDWIDTLSLAGMNEQDALEKFDEYLTFDLGDKRTLQRDLEDIQLRSAVRANCRRRAAELALTLG